MKSTLLEKTLLEVAEFLGQRQIPYMVIGGIANAFWGEPRTTLDVDVTISIPEENLSLTIKEINRSFKILIGEPEEFVKRNRALPVKSATGPRVDFIFALLPYEEQAISRAVKHNIGGHTVNICAVEDLIIHKIISERPKDREDVRQIMHRQKANIDRKYLAPILKGLSIDLERPDIWERYLEVFPEENS